MGFYLAAFVYVLVQGAAHEPQERVKALQLKRKRKARQGGHSHRVPVQHFGPSGCVSLKRLPATRSCALSTHCDGQDLSDVEFAFDCYLSEAGGTTVRHSYGRGGFDPQEDFDTGIRCDACFVAGSATGDHSHGKRVAELNSPVPVRELSSSGAQAGGEQSGGAPVLAKVGGGASSNAASFGPSNCVSTYLGPYGTCVVQTACADVDMSGYEYSIVCTDDDGSPTRHSFGVDSFDAEEEFDTQIACDKCWGPDGLPAIVTATEKVDALTSSLVEMAARVHWLEHMIGQMAVDGLPPQDDDTQT